MRRDGPAALRFLLALFLVGIPCWFAALWLSNQYRFAHCPPGTFVTGTAEPALQYLGIAGLSMTLSFFIARQLKRVEWLRKADDPNLVPGFVYLIGLAGLSVMVVLGAVSRYCATNSSILYDDVANGITKTFTWQDVAAVTTRCYFQSGKSSSWRENFFVTMTDRTTLDLMDSGTELPAFYPRLASALNGLDYTFSAHISRGCQYSHLEMLTDRP